MWSVFIADDEPKIRRRLKRMVESEGPEFFVCGEADNGMEALQIVRQQLPDILLVDICMPKLNGLDFIDRISEIASDSIILVITGHNEFDFAQRAVQLPIYDYILKPVEVGFFKEVLHKTAAELKKRKNQNKLIQWAEKRVQEDGRAQVQKLFEDWLFGKSSPRDIKRRIDLLPCSFPEYPVLLALQFNTLYYSLAAMEWKDFDSLRPDVDRIVSDMFSDNAAEIAFTGYPNRLFYIVSGGQCSEQLCKTLEKRIHKETALPLCVIQQAFRAEYDDFKRDYSVICRKLDSNMNGAFFLAKISRVLDCRYMEKTLTLEELAAHLSLSSGYLSRLLKKYTGFSFSEFLNRFRILQAMKRLKEKEELIYETADAAGYSSQHYFSRMFKKYTGITPAEYRRAQEGFK